MKFAAKRTWPVRPDTWEYQGEAPSAAIFAERFASDRQLAQATEMVVIEKDGEDNAISFHKVIGVAPYRIESTATPGAATPAATATPESPAVAAESSRDADNGAASVRSDETSEAPPAVDVPDHQVVPASVVRPAMRTGIYMVKVFVIGMVLVFLAAYFMY